MHTKHCLSSAKAIPIQETQKLHCVDAVASDAENLCKGCLDSAVNIFEDFCSEFFERTLQDVYNMPEMFYLAIQL